MYPTSLPIAFLEADAAYHRDRAVADFRSASYRHDVRRRRRARKVAAARRQALQRAAIDVR